MILRKMEKSLEILEKWWKNYFNTYLVKIYEKNN